MTEPPGRDFEEIEAASDHWMRAWRDQDEWTLDKLLANDFILVVATAPSFRFDRESWLELALGSYVCTRFRYEDIQFHRLGTDLVAMSAIADMDAALGSEDRSGRFFVTDVWRRSDKRWRVCARYSSPPAKVDQGMKFMVDFGR